MNIHDNILGTIGNTPVVRINKLGPGVLPMVTLPSSELTSWGRQASTCS